MAETKCEDYYLTIITHSRHALEQAGLDLSEDDLALLDSGDLLNEPVALEDGIKRINELMHETHPSNDFEGFSYNFFVRTEGGKIIHVDADGDGWFKRPVYEACISCEPKDFSEVIQKRDGSMARSEGSNE